MSYPGSSSFKIKGLGNFTTLKTIIYYDRPLLFLCEDDKTKQKYITSFIELINNFIDRWLFFPISEQMLDPLILKWVPLREILANPNSGYIWDVRLYNEKTSIYKITPLQLMIDDLPDSDFYAPELGT